MTPPLKPEKDAIQLVVRACKFWKLQKGPWKGTTKQIQGTALTHNHAAQADAKDSAEYETPEDDKKAQQNTHEKHISVFTPEQDPKEGERSIWWWEVK